MALAKKLKKGCDEIKHYQRVLKEKTCQELKDAAYGCSCGKVVKEKKVCTTFDQCYAAAVTSKENNEKEIKKKNAAAKLEWRAVGRIECLIKVMSGKKKGRCKATGSMCQGTPSQHKAPGFKVSSHAAETEVCT